MVIVSGIILVSIICLAARDFGGSGKNNVSGNYEKSENEINTDTDDTDANAIIQDLKHASIMPIETEELGLANNNDSVNAGTSTQADKGTEEVTSQVQNEEVVVENVTEATTIENVVETVATESVAETTASENYMEETAAYTSVDFEISESDYYWLTKIVEAEAGDQDEIGKILVANVIINRVKSEKFPNTIQTVIFENDGRTYQFEPVKNGRIYDMTPASSTINCVDRAINGEDYSEGALYFTMKTSSRSWFNTSLTFLFVHGDHYFYT
jgi:N-acetylmuramoyl-L-alanine amidase